MTRYSPKIAATAIATLGLSTLSPVQQGAVMIAAGTAALWAAPALAQNAIPRVGTVVKKNAGSLPIMTPSDANGETRLTGLEPGEYNVQVFEGGEETTMRVGEDGRLAFVAYEDTKRSGSAAAPARRRWAEAIPFDGAEGKMPDNAVVLDLKTTFAVSPPTACARPRRGMPSNCPGRIRNHIDVNASPAEEMIRLAPTLSREAAQFIVAERSRAPYKGGEDFMKRVCPKVTVDFDDAPIKMDDFLIFMKRGGDPKAAGFKCNPGGGAGNVPQVNIFGGPILILDWVKWL
jgi:hypothetical protein